MGKSSRSNRKKALGTERRRHLEVAQWEEKSAAARAEALGKCLAAEPVPVSDVAAADADEMEADDRGRQGAPEEQQQKRQQGKKKRRGRGDGMEVEAQPLKKKLPGRGSLKGLNHRADFVNVKKMIMTKKVKGKKADAAALWFVGQD